MTTVIQQGVLRGLIKTEVRLTGAVLAQKGRLQAVVAIPLAAQIDAYEGDYEVTPRIDSQTLETAGKRMKDNVQIKAIPFFDVSNNSGGSTVYIGSSII